MTAEANESQNGSVFISYSRKDKEFVRKLHEGLVANSVKVWVDWEGIPLSADWMDEIVRAVKGSDAFLVVLSPDWLASKVCAQELELGLSNNKKLIPILYRAPEPGTPMHEKVAATNWVYMRAEDNFEATLPRLIEAINTDLDWVRNHTRLLQRATEWVNHNRNNSFLLQGTDLQNAETWMAQATTNASRQVLPLQMDYILAGRKEAERRHRRTMIAISTALFISILLGVIALVQWRNAIDSANLAWAQRNSSEARIYQKDGGELDISTFLAIDSFNISRSIDSAYEASYQAEDILRQNLAYMPLPVSRGQMAEGNEITNIEFSFDRLVYATNGSSGQICVWDARSHQQHFCVSQGEGFNDAVFTPNGFLVTGGDDGNVNFRNAEDGAIQRRLAIGASVTDLEVSPDGNWLAIGREDRNATLFYLTDPQVPSTNLALNDAVGVLRISPDSQWLAVGTMSGEVNMFRLGNPVSIPGSRHDGKEVLAIAFSPDSQFVASAGGDSKVRIAITMTGFAKLPPLVHDDWVEDVVFSSDGKTIVAAADDNRVWRWDVDTGQPKPRLHHNGFVMRARFSSDGRWIASTGADKTMRVWDANSGALMAVAALDAGSSSVAFSRDDSRVIVGQENGAVTVWDIRPLHNLLGSIRFSELIHEVKLAPSGQWIAANTDDFAIWKVNRADLLTIGTGTQGTPLFSADGLTYSMDISADSNWVVVAETNKSRAILYNVQKNHTVELAHGSPVTDVAFTPDSLRVATSGKDQKIILWDVLTGSKILEMSNPAPVLSITIRFDGKYLVAGLQENEACPVWDLSTGEKMPVDLRMPGGAIQIAFSPDGQWLAAGDTLGGLEVWNVKDMTNPVLSLERKQNGRIASLLFSPGHNWLLSGSSDGFVHIWDLVSGDELARLPHPNPVTSMAVIPDEKWLLAASNKVIQIWNLEGVNLVPSKDLAKVACKRLLFNLSRSEWETIYGKDKGYYSICPGLPEGK